MVKNWIILGDAALKDADWTIGKIDFSQDEVPNWKNIALERIKAAKTERMSDFAKKGEAIDFSGTFYVKNNITQSDFDDFCNQVAHLFGVKVGRHELDLYKHKVNYIDIVLPGIPMKGALDLVWPGDEPLNTDNLEEKAYK